MTSAVREALADALLRAEAAEAERDRLTEQLSSARERWAHYYEALKAAEAERDEARKVRDQFVMAADENMRRALAAEAERDRLRDALRIIADKRFNVRTAPEFARAALTHTEHP